MVSIWRISLPCGALGALIKVVLGVWFSNDASQPPWSVTDLDAFSAVRVPRAYCCCILTAEPGFALNPDLGLIQILTPSF